MTIFEKAMLHYRQNEIDHTLGKTERYKFTGLCKGQIVCGLRQVQKSHHGTNNCHVHVQKCIPRSDVRTNPKWTIGM